MEEERTLITEDPIYNTNAAAENKGLDKKSEESKLVFNWRRWQPSVSD